MLRTNKHANILVREVINTNNKVRNTWGAEDEE